MVTPFKCLYCSQREPDVTFKSKGHIIPESLGNKEAYILQGFECDKCNQYFSKIESRFINNVPSMIERTTAGIPNKKDRYPTLERPGIKISYGENGATWDIDVSMLPEGAYKVDKETGQLRIHIPELTKYNIYSDWLRLLLKMGLGLLLFKNLQGRVTHDPYETLFDSCRYFTRNPMRKATWELWLGSLEKKSLPELGQYDEGKFIFLEDDSVIFCYKYGFQALACNLVKSEISSYRNVIEQNMTIQSSQIKIAEI